MTLIRTRHQLSCVIAKCLLFFRIAFTFFAFENLLYLCLGEKAREVGYHLARVSDIVKRAGLTQAAFYLYFPSKEAVYQELRQSFFARLWELAESGQKVTLLPAERTEAQLRENLLDMFQFFASMPELTRVFLQETETGEELHRQIASRVAANLRKNQEAGHVRPDLSVEAAAESVVAILYRLTFRFLLAVPVLWAAHKLGEKMGRMLPE